ncbi:MAG TPA: hypothetical protein VFV35_07570 [Acidimicrobiales bacterium]|nr:hypothetical protein [Acidimicrobiales bacterium]
MDTADVQGARAPERPRPQDVLRRAFDNVGATFGRQLAWYRDNPILAAVCAVAGFAVAWLANTAIMAVKYDGYVVQPGAAVAGKGNVLWGGAFWALVPGLLAAVVVYTIRVGPRSALAQLAGLPSMVRGASRFDGAAVPHLLGGIAVGSVVPLLAVPVISGALSGWLLFLLATRLRSTLVAVVSSVWRFVFERATGRDADGVSASSTLVAISGSLLAMVVGWLVPSKPLVLLAAVVAGVLAVVLGRQQGSPRPATAGVAVLVVLGAAFVAFVLAAPETAADDGGWKECGRPGLVSWATDCGGSSDLLLQALLFGGPPGLFGALFGGGLGGSTPGEEDPPFLPGTGCNPPPDDRPMSPERAELLRWRQLHPDAPYSEYWEYKQRVEEFHRWEQEPDDPFYERWWRDAQRYNEELGKALWEDYDSGNMGDRLRRMPKHAIPALWNATKTMVTGLAQQGIEMGKAGGPVNYAFKQGFDMLVRNVEFQVELDTMRRNGATPEQLSERAWQEFDAVVPGAREWGAKYVEASLTNDNETLAKMTMEAWGHVTVDAVTGKAMDAGVGHVAKTQYTKALNAEVAATKTVPTTPRTREQLLATADRHGTVRMSPDEAPLLGLESDIATGISEMHVRNGGSTEFKLGATENVAMRESGQYQPKPGCYVGPDGVEAPSLLVKSVNETDVAINPNLAGKERIVSFVDGPEPPKGTPEHSRWQWRQQEKVDLRASMEELGTKGGIKIDEHGNPVPYWVDELPDGTLVDRDTGKPFIPDNDTYTGDPGSMTREQYQAELYRLGRGTIQHPGDTPNWHIPADDPDFAYKTKVKEKVINDVQKEGRIKVDGDGVHLCKTPTKPPDPFKAPTWGAPAGYATAAGASATGAAPPGYEGPAPGGGAPPGYDAPTGGGAPPGYNSPAGGGGAPPGY